MRRLAVLKIHVYRQLLFYIVWVLLHQIKVIDRILIRINVCGGTPQNLKSESGLFSQSKNVS